jgi:hypothetical protein
MVVFLPYSTRPRHLAHLATHTRSSLHIDLAHSAFFHASITSDIELPRSTLVRLVRAIVVFPSLPRLPPPAPRLTAASISQVQSPYPFDLCYLTSYTASSSSRSPSSAFFRVEGEGEWLDEPRPSVSAACPAVWKSRRRNYTYTYTYDSEHFEAVRAVAIGERRTSRRTATSPLAPPTSSTTSMWSDRSASRQHRGREGRARQAVKATRTLPQASTSLQAVHLPSVSASAAAEGHPLPHGLGLRFDIRRPTSLLSDRQTSMSGTGAPTGAEGPSSALERTPSRPLPRRSPNSVRRTAETATA